MVKERRGLVISGGGSKGAWAGGVVEQLKENGTNWEVYIGTSTGNFVAPMTAVGDIDKLKESYLGINQKSIFSLNPFNKKGKIKVLNAALRVLMGKTSVGSAKNLEKLIKQFFTKKDYEKIKNKTVISTVTNLTKSRTEFKYNKHETYEDFCDWMLASASVPLVFDLVEKNGDQYVDGGVLENIPIQQAIDEGCDEIDIIVLSPQRDNVRYAKVNNMFELSSRLVSVMLNEFEKDDIKISKLKANHKDVKLNFYYTPTSLTSNCINFDKKEMKKWWEEGYEFAKDKSMVKKMLIKSF